MFFSSILPLPRLHFHPDKYYRGETLHGGFSAHLGILHLFNIYIFHSKESQKQLQEKTDWIDVLEKHGIEETLFISFFSK